MAAVIFDNGFAVNFSAGISEIFALIDEEAIKQALVNLISNAEKYSSDKKMIDLEVKVDAHSVIINVKDRGKGVSLKDAQKIFKEFYRADDSLTSEAKGTGLGLTIAQRIIKDHRGDILYFPRDGGGSVFQITLPV